MLDFGDMSEAARNSENTPTVSVPPQKACKLAYHLRACHCLSCQRRDADAFSRIILANYGRKS